MGIVIEEYYGDINRAGVEDLVNYFGLGKLVGETLVCMRCRTINDLKRLKLYELNKVTTQKTARRIMLLKKYAELRWPGI